MDESSKPGLEREFKRLERRLDELVGVVAQLKEENKALRQRQDTLSAERATLMLARTRALSDLQHACAPAHRAMLEQAIADLDQRLKALEI